MRSIKEYLAIMLFALIAVLYGCVEDSGDGNPLDMTDDERKETVSSAFNELRRDGFLPELDRSDNVMGEDLDQNGIRDDIERYIENQAYTPTDLSLLRSFARAYQRIQTSEEMTVEKASLIGSRILETKTCLYKQGSDVEILDDVHDEINAFTANTQERLYKLSNYASKLMVIEAKSIDCDAIISQNNSQSNKESLIQHPKTKQLTLDRMCYSEKLPVKEKLGLGFFNGVNNTQTDAYDSLYETESALRFYGNEWDVFNTNYYGRKVFLNPTEGFLNDISETFMQRASERGLTPEAKEFVDTNPGFIQVIRNPQSRLARRFMSSLKNEGFKVFLSNYGQIEMWQNSKDNEALQEVYEIHKKQIKPWIDDGRKMILVAHSQGNLFVNKAYDSAIEMGAKKEDINVIHVAPASIDLNGPYILADTDVIIRPLLDSPEPNAINVAYNSKDKTGHNYINTYLNKNLQSGRLTFDELNFAYKNLAPNNDYGDEYFNRDKYEPLTERLFNFDVNTPEAHLHDDFNVKISEYSDYYPGDQITPNPINVINISKDYTSLYEPSCDIVNEKTYITWEFEIDLYPDVADLGVGDIPFTVFIRTANNEEIYSKPGYADSGYEGYQPVTTVRGSITAEIRPTKTPGEFEVIVKGKDNQSTIIVR